LNIPVHKKGTVVVIEGPRFSTKAESRWYSSMGWEVINMTQYPEVVLARELGICYVNISLITDYDAGLEGDKDIKPVTAQEVIKIFNQNVEQVKKLIFTTIQNIPKERGCKCGEAPEEAGV
jgi:5'-methylthioadenosine phosphorylase